MNTLARLIDPQRSLATAVGWLTVLLSLAIAAAMVWVGNAAREQLLAERDAAMVNAAEAVAAELDTALAARLQATSTAGASSDALNALRPELAAIVAQACERARLEGRMRALLLDSDQRVLVDKRASRPRPANDPAAAGSLSTTPMPVLTQGEAVLQRLDSGRRQVAVQAHTEPHPTLRRLGLQLMLVRPSEGSLWQGGEMQRQIAWMTLGVSLAAGVVGIALARRLTHRLTSLTTAVKQVENDTSKHLDPPAGRDEVATLGHAFSVLLGKLRRERDALNALTAQLEQRVQTRTREVERLAADSRYAAVVRERLRLARDLHDTLAHSMMALLSEIRMLRTLHAHDPGALAAELERAEQVARDGLNEARAAIGQMRLNAVRDLGLGPTLAGAVNRFAERTGVDVSYSTDPFAASFADSRAEVMFRIAEETLRNIDRHAHASHVDVALRDCDDATIELCIEDDGVGFDAASSYSGHYGLVGMREQAQLIDAELSLTSTPQRGTSLRLRLRVGAELQS
jgi:signal transduction histidine kinase